MQPKGENESEASLTPTAMASILEAHRDSLLEKWERRVLADPGLPLAGKLSRPALRDHFPAIVRRLTATLRMLAERPEELGRLVGSAEEAQDHVRGRMAAEYSVPEVLRELSHLRLAILDLCDDVLPDGAAAAILHATCDQMMINAADELSRVALEARSQAEALAAKQTTLYRREREARQACEDAHKAKDQFLAVVSHELRTPLNAIAGWAQMLAQHPDDAHMRERAVATIRRNAGIQASLIDGLLDITRLRSGQLATDRARFDLVALIKTVIESFMPSITEKALRFDASRLPLDCPFAGDEPRLRQVFTNLLGNAIKFTPEGGAIHVSLEALPDCVRIEIADSGVGIPSEFLPHVFEPFRQADSSWTRKHKGLGLGLAIAKAIIDLHRGTIEATSGGPGQGATFRVTLPKSDYDGTAPEVPSLEGASAAPNRLLSGVRVIVVDDDDDARSLTAAMLADEGCEVRAVASANEAYELFRTFSPHVLATDLAMPGEDGISLLRRVRTAYGRVPTLAISAFSGPTELQRIAAAGFDGHVMKPVVLRELVSMIANLVDRGPKDRVHDGKPSVLLTPDD